MLAVSCWPWCLGDARLVVGPPAGIPMTWRADAINGRSLWRPAGSSVTNHSFADVGRRHAVGQHQMASKPGFYPFAALVRRRKIAPMAQPSIEPFR
jgi:hypothetical protein